jgi:uncharacterized protein
MSGYFELKAAAGGQVMWNLKAGNHEIILTSELYKARESALNGIASVKANVPDDKRFERKAAKDGQFYFVLTAGNGHAIGKNEMYRAEAGRDNGIQSVKHNAPTAITKELK